jgi:HEAT repeat protein
MISVAQLSRTGRRRESAFAFLAPYLSHPRTFLRAAAAQALGELRDPQARELLEPIAADKHNARLAKAAQAALVQLDKETKLVPEEVSELRRQVRELRENQEKLEKTLDELKSMSGASRSKDAASGSKR